MKIVKWIAIVAIVLVLAIVVIGFILPSKYHVERSVTIDAPPDVVFKYLNDLEQWEHWEPFSKADSSIVTTRGDTTTGVGASQSWTGDSGKGALVFTVSDPEKGIEYDLTFDEYDPTHSMMTFEVVEGKTVLTWVLDGDMSVPVLGGYLAASMDSMVGPMYENGLADIKKVAEGDGGGLETGTEE